MKFAHNLWGNRYFQIISITEIKKIGDTRFCSDSSNILLEEMGTFTFASVASTICFNSLSELSEQSDRHQCVLVAFTFSTIKQLSDQPKMHEEVKLK